MEKVYKQNCRPRIGIALGSGAARGYAHIGVLKVLERENIPIDIIVGTSMGAVIGAAYAMGYSSKELEQMALQMRWRSLLYLVEPTINKYGLIAGSKLEKYFEILTNGKNFCQLEKTLIVVATDITTGREVRFSEGPIAKALRASVAVPGLFLPVKKGDKLLVDGSITNSVPVSAAIDAGADIVIAVDVGSDMDFSSPVGWVLDRFEKILAKRVVHVVKRSPFEIVKIVGKSMKLCYTPKYSINQRLSHHYCFKIRPVVGNIRWFEFYRASECIKAGEIAAEEIVKKIKFLLNNNEDMTVKSGFNLQNFKEDKKKSELYFI